MKCSCGRPRPISPDIVGIQYGPEWEEDDCTLKTIVPALILWNCRCGSTRAIPWAAASEPQRAEARLAELSRQAGNEMTCR